MVEQEIESNSLYIVGTPIGNLADMTERAVYILEQADYIYCEDTRVTGNLLSKFNIKAKLNSCHAHNETIKSQEIISLIQDNKTVAYVSDAGTPGLSDPGNLLVQECNRHNIKVIPIPGMSALTTLISVSGFNLSKGFFFAGFLPRKPGKFQKLLDEHNIVFAFESPHRIYKSLELIKEHKPDCIVCIGRELTKKFEEIINSPIQELNIDTIKEKGEFVLGIYTEPKKKVKVNKYKN